MKNQSVLIRADANPEVGTRSVKRCLSLARSLRKMGVKVEFVCGQIPSVLSRQVEESGCELVSIHTDGQSEREIKTVNELLVATNPAWLVVDGERFDSKFQKKLELGNTKLISLSRSTNFLVRTDAVKTFSHQSVATGHSIFNLDSDSTSSGVNHAKTLNQTVLDGTQFVIDVANPNANEHSEKKIPAKIRRVAIVVDGQDRKNLTAKSIVALNNANFTKLSVEVFVDAQNVNRLSIEDAALESRHDIRLCRNVDRFGLRLSRVDVALASAESRFCEIMAAGIPVIWFDSETAHNTATSNRADGTRGPILNPTVSASEIENQFFQLGKNRTLRKQLSGNALRTMDGDGADRIARAMISLNFAFRTPTIADANLLLNWRNDPELRAICFHQEPIDFESHRDWLSNKIRSELVVFRIIEDNKQQSVGQFRLDFEPDQNSCRLNISLIPSLRGSGLGTAFIERACRVASERVPGIEVFAYIKSNNIVSQSAFRKAGFDASSTETINSNVAIRFAKKIGKPTMTKIQYRKAS